MTTPPAGPYAAAAPPPRPRHLRGFRTLVTGVLVALVGFVVIAFGAVELARQSFGKVDDFARVPVSAGGTIHLTRTGAYVGYYETPGATGGTAQIRMGLSDPAGHAVHVRTYGTTLTYDVDGHHGRALYTFRITTAGTYTVTVSSDPVVPGAKLAFGESIAAGLAAGIVLVVIGILLVLAAAALVVIGLVRRSRHKTQLRMPEFPNRDGGRYRGVG